MNYMYLENLQLSKEEKEKLSRLGASNPLSLLSMINVSPDAFISFLGKERVDEITAALTTTISGTEQDILNQPRYHQATGAIISDDIPAIKMTSSDTDERDRVFEELKNLKQQKNPPPEMKKRIAELEDTLKSLLEKRIITS